MHIGTNFDTRGLLLSLDSANHKSYNPNTDTTWKDVHGKRTPGELRNAPTWSNADRSFEFDGTNDHIEYTRNDLNGGSFAYDEITLYILFKPVTTGYNKQGRSANLFTIENVIEISVGDNENGYGQLNYKENGGSWRGTSSDVLTNGSWNMITYTHSTSTSTLYVNGSSVYTLSNSGALGSGNSSYPNVTLMGKRSGRNSVTPGKLARVEMYDRVHSTREIQSRWNRRVTYYR